MNVVSSGGVLVTGASGRTGRRMMLAAPEGWTGAVRVGGSGMVELDVRDRDSWRAALEALRPRVVVHLAVIVGTEAERDEGETEAANVRPLELLVEEGSRAGVERIVFASSAAIYGDRRPDPLRETDAPDPLSHYGRSKLAAEHRLYRAVAAGDIAVAVALRLFNVTGPGMTDSLIARLMRSTDAEPVALRGFDGFVRDYVHVDDVAEAIRSGAEEALPPGLHLLNVGRGIPVSNRVAVDEVTRARGSAPFTIVAEHLESVSMADVAGAERMLGFRARRAITAE